MARTADDRSLQEPAFNISSGALCLDLTNTLGDRRGRHEERLGSYEDLIAWAFQAGIVTGSESRCLLDEASRHPGKARAVLRKARILREAIYSVFSSLATGGDPAPEYLETLNSALPGSLSRLAIAQERSGFRWRWSPCRDLDGILAPVVESASELLTSADLRRVRVCEAGDCAWLFMDRSRNRTRRWCDMAACGNRAKARRHYRRVREAAPIP
jgi:predicted RNA-binding Zn ribbon-like protein